MKSHIRQPELKTVLELNRKYGIGYQARMILDGIESVIDDEPYTLYDVAQGAVAAIEEINSQGGYNYKPHEVLQVTDEALRANKDADLASARMYRDAQSGKHELITPSGGDCREVEIDGKKEIAFTGRGTVLVTYFSWLDDHLPRAHEALRRYCEYLALHGYGGGATEIMDELDGMDKDRGTEWIKATYGKHVDDDAALIQYIMSF